MSTEAQKEYYRRRYRANREAILAKRREHDRRPEVRASRLDYFRRHYAENRDRILAQQAAARTEERRARKHATDRARWAEKRDEINARRRELYALARYDTPTLPVRPPKPPKPPRIVRVKAVRMPKPRRIVVTKPAPIPRPVVVRPPSPPWEPTPVLGAVPVAITPARVTYLCRLGHSFATKAEADAHDNLHPVPEAPIVIGQNEELSA